MTTAQERKKFEKALAKAKAAFADIDLSTIALPLESQADIIREAASVIAYFDMSAAFKEETCRGCGQLFAYAYYTSSVKHCSIPCLKKMVESIGLFWDPSKPYEERWGSRYIPAVVPSVVYAVVKKQAPEPEEVPGPAVGAADLMAKLHLLSEAQEES